MSFITSIEGNAPANTFIYTTTTVSVDNISATNLSATNASIGNLTTLVFTPVNVNASNIYALQADIVELNSSTVNSSLVETNDIVADEGTINVLQANNLTSANANMSYLNVSEFNCSNSIFDTISSEDISTTTFDCSTGDITNILFYEINARNISSLYMSSTNMSCWNIHALFAQTDNLYFQENVSGLPPRGIIRKRGDLLQIIGGVPTAGNIGFSVDGVSFPMVFDGELNISSQINASYIEVDQLYAPDASYINTTSETDTTDKLLLRESNPLGYEYSYLARDAGILQVVGKSSQRTPTLI